jgi:hypothetical protein
MRTELENAIKAARLAVDDYASLSAVTLRDRLQALVDEIEQEHGLPSGILDTDPDQDRKRK